MARRPLTSLGLALALALALPGCGLSGFVYHHVVTPLDRNLTGDEVTDVLPGTRVNKLSTKQVTVNSVSVEWDERGIGDVAREFGLTEVYYVDQEVLSVLGVWTQRWVHIYGR